MFLGTALTATLAAMTVSVSAFSPSDSILEARQQISSSNLHVLRDSRSPGSSSSNGGYHPAILLKRQEDEATITASSDPSAATSAFTLVENPPSNETEWNEVTEAACILALSALDEATNPSGNCVCYNLPAIDTNTGVFQADMRMFRVSDARDDFVGIEAQDIQVGLSYTGASVSETASETVARRSASRGGLAKRSDPTPLREWMFVGQIDEDILSMAADMTVADLEALVMPVVTLTGMNGNTEVSAIISMNEASFVTGVFADEVILSNFAAAQLAVEEQVAGLEDGTVVFQVPGVRIMIFPVALIIVSFWLILFVGAVGYGTVQRLKFREQFRRRTAVVQKGSAGTI